MKRIMVEMFAMVIIIGLIFVNITVISAPIYVEAADELPTVNEAEVTKRIMELAKKFGINDGNLNDGTGVCFTDTGNVCSHGKYDANGYFAACDHCNVTNIVKNSAWFANLFGYNISNEKWLPPHAGVQGETRTRGWNCCGFANFALWYIAQNGSTSDVYRDTLGSIGQAFNRDTLESAGIKIGDVICVGNTQYGSIHSAVFIDFVDGGVKVLDCNYVGTGRLAIHTLSYSSYPLVSITRARNYVPDTSVAPQGCLDSVTVLEDDNVWFSGWAFDRDDLNQSVDIHIYADDNTFVGSGTANVSRPDVNAVFNVGDNHGFSFGVNTKLEGTHKISVWAVDGTHSTYLGDKTVELPVTPEVVKHFEDINKNDWYVNAVQYVYDNSIMAGTTETTFRPADTLTREQFTQVLYNHMGKPSTGGISNPFSDVHNAWYTNSVLWAKSNNIANGKSNTVFGVGQNITREELALMLYKYAQLRGYNVMTDVEAINPYADNARVSSWSWGAMNWAVTHGIMSGKGSGGNLSTYRLDPQGNATRAECASMMKKLLTMGE